MEYETDHFAEVSTTRLRILYKGTTNSNAFAKEDELVYDQESEVESRVEYMRIMRLINTPTEKFIAMCMEMGYNKAEIAYMLGYSKNSVSVVVRMHQRIQRELLPKLQASSKVRKQKRDNQSVI